jgi:hypothetical protein
VYWAIAYGTGTLPAGCLVSFQSAGVRYRRTVEVPAQQLDEVCWVADAEGVFSTAATVTAGIETARVQLADRW